MIAGLLKTSIINNLGIVFVLSVFLNTWFSINSFVLKNLQMKKILILSLLLIFSISSFSQSKEDCLSNLSIFAEYAKVKNYDAAYEPWLEVKSQCPELNIAIYVYGERLLKSFIKKSLSLNDDPKTPDAPVISIFFIKLIKVA